MNDKSNRIVCLPLSSTKHMMVKVSYDRRPLKYLLHVSVSHFLPSKHVRLDSGAEELFNSEGFEQFAAAA